jgi:hypothetical protein
MKQSYEAPVMEIVRFDCEDVITTSDELIIDTTGTGTNG